ncbi:MAG: single-stranded DNA-binding protein [Syntrophomonadaceae bacterium]|nr:single-stranded DNA-binding protein [Syntrophomonadaceae bacterium]
MLNTVNLIGRLGQDPGESLRYSQTGTAVMRFTLAVNRRPDQNGNSVTDWIDCVTFGKVAENMAIYLEKGSQVAVEGRLQVRNYQTQDGQKRKAVEVVAASVHFLGKKNPNQTGGTAGQTADTTDDWYAYGQEVGFDDSVY